MRIGFVGKQALVGYWRFLFAPLLLLTAAPAWAVIAPTINAGVFKTVDHTNGLVGTYFQFTVLVTNMDTGTMSNIVVSDSLPTGLQLEAWTASAGSSYNTNTGNWSITNVPPAGSSKLNITAQIVASGLMTNTAFFSSGNPFPTNPNTSKVTVFGVPTTGLFALVREVSAEGRIVGPVTNATVVLPGVGTRLTDARGQALFTNISPATYSVTVTNSGYYPVTHDVVVTKGQVPFDSFQMLKQGGPGPPSQFDFKSPQGNYFIPSMPGNLTFSVIIAWNGTPGSVNFNVAGTQMAATITDLGNGTARATLTIPALAVIAAASELTISVTNGENLSRAFNLATYFEPLPGMVSTWFTWLGNSILWAGAQALSGNPKISYSYKTNFTIYSNSIPSDSLTISSTLGVSLDLAFTPKDGAFKGAVGAKGTGNLEVKLPGVAGIEVFIEGSIGLKGTLKIAFAGLNPPAITPGWGISLEVKDGMKAPAVAFIPAVVPAAAPAVSFLQNTWGVKKLVNSVKLGFSLTEGGNIDGVYQNLAAGNCFLRTTSLSGGVTAGVELEAAAKLGAAKLKIFGGGNGKLEFDLCPNFKLNSLTLEAYAGVSASAFGFSYDKKFSAELKFGGSGQQLTLLHSSGMPALSTGDWELSGPELLRWGPPNELPSAASGRGRPRVAGKGSVESLVVSNVLDLASPSVFADSSETLILLSTYDSLKPPYAATDISALRQTNGGPWTLTRVTDDLMGDYVPKVTGVGAGLLLGAWERVAGDVSGATNPVEVVAHLEIAAAWFDRVTGLWSAPTQLTTNGVVDRDPQPVVFGATQGILWIQNQAGDGMGNSTNGDSLVFSQWTGSSWGAPQTLWSGPNGILSFSFVADGSGQGRVVFALDQDGNLDTQDDVELYSLATVAGVWQAAVRLTTDSLEDAKPTLVAPNGAALCVWSRGTNLVYSPLNAWNPKTVFAQTTSANHTPTLDGVTVPGGAAITYAVQATDGVDAFAAFYSAAQDSWSLPRQLTQDKDVESSITTGFNGTNVVVVYEKTQTVFSNLDLTLTNGQTITLTNVPQQGRTDLYLLTHSTGSDAGLRSNSLSIDPPNPAPGSNATISAVVENLGDSQLQNIPVSFYDGNPQQGGTQIGSSQIVSSLIGGATQQVAVAWTVPPGNNSHNIFVIVDPAQVLSDRDRSNNTNSLVTVQPDLAFDTTSSAEGGATTVTLLAQVVNQGVVAAGAFDVSWRLGSPTGEEIGKNTVSGLGPGQSTAVSFVWDTSGRFFAEPYAPVYAVADTTNSVAEFDETNNDALEMVPVVASWVPRITSITRLSGGNIQIAFTSANSAPTDFVIESTQLLNDPLSWQSEAGAVIVSTAPGAFQTQLTPQGAARYYRVRTSQ